MTDEKYSYIQDVKDKKTTARSARNKRTHNGKGGSVKFPSDYMTQKEIKAMSGEVKSYRLNKPMSWLEFKAMPNDIQYGYIKLLKEKYHVPNTSIEKMFGLGNGSLASHMKHIGYNVTSLSHGKFDKEGWLAFVNGVPTQKEEPAEEVPICDESPANNDTVCEDQKEIIHPCSGTLSFVGTTEATLDAVKHILGNETMKITISWEAV
jgi:hypothetical protein